MITFIAFHSSVCIYKDLSDSVAKMCPAGKKSFLAFALVLAAIGCCALAAPEAARKRLVETPMITCASTLCVKGSVCRETEYGPKCECYQCQTFVKEEPVCANDGRTYG